MVGVWIEPVTAQVMMTLFDVAMFEAFPVLRPAPMRTGSIPQMSDLAWLSCHSPRGARSKMPHRAGAVNIVRRGFEPFGGPPLPIPYQGHTGLPILRGDQPMSITKKIAAVSLAALTMGAVFL